MRKCFLDNLPKSKHINVMHINWKNTIGYNVNFIYDDIKDCFKITKYIRKNNRTYIEVLYNNKIYLLQTDSIIKCELGRILNKKTSRFKIEIGQVFKDDKRDLTIINREYRKDNKNSNLKYYKYHCNKCGNEDWITEDSLLKHKTGCNVCCKYSNKVIKGINDIATTHPNLIKYLVNKEDGYKYSYGSNIRVLCKCPNCGFEKEIEVRKLVEYGFICNKCNDKISYPNKFMFNLLEQLNVEFKNEYSPDWIGRMRYDFYIPSMNLIIEMDGGLGHGNKLFSKSNRTIKETIKIDNYKDKLAREHNIEVIRIDCNYKETKNRFKYIKDNILHSRISEIFNLNNIDWNNINNKSQKSKLFEICKYWEKNININKGNITISDICKMFNLGKTTVRNYLKRGNELNLCSYNPKEEKKKNYAKIKKQIEIFKNDKSLGVFESVSELSRQSEKLFGIYLNLKSISAVANGKRKSHKGYTFKYVDNK